MISTFSSSAVPPRLSSEPRVLFLILLNIEPDRNAFVVSLGHWAIVPSTNF